MLCLTRKAGERIVLRVPGHKDIVITLVDTERGKARVGIDAEKDVVILRGELDEAAPPPLAPRDRDADEARRAARGREREYQRWAEERGQVDGKDQKPPA